MSPLVERSRVGAVRRPDPADQHWSMLMFESLSAGAIAVGVGIVAVLTVVCLYAVIVWPLTFWDLADPSLAKYASWTDTVLWSIFAGGSLAGFWCFSGAAFKNRPKRKATHELLVTPKARR